MEIIKMTTTSETLRKDFGSLVKEHRCKEKWSQQKLEEKSGISRSYINRIECGKINPTLETIAVLAFVFGCEIRMLVPQWNFFAKEEQN